MSKMDEILRVFREATEKKAQYIDDCFFLAEDLIKRMNEHFEYSEKQKIKAAFPKDLDSENKLAFQVKVPLETEEEKAKDSQKLFPVAPMIPEKPRQLDFVMKIWMGEEYIGSPVKTFQVQHDLDFDLEQEEWTISTEEEDQYREFLDRLYENILIAIDYRCGLR